MESQPKNPEFRSNPENFHPCNLPLLIILSANQPPNIELGMVTTQGTTLNTQPCKNR